MVDLPCQKIIGKACFKEYPRFARRAIAYRLLHLLIPPDIAKILPKKLSDPLIAPGVTIPLDAKFPPGTCIVPGCSFPAGWDPEDEPPECSKSAPLPPLAMMLSGGNPPSYLSPGPGGPLPVQPPTPVPESEPWFYDGFDGADVDWTVWTANNFGNGYNVIDTGRLKQYCTDDFSTAEIDTAEDATIPAAFELTFELEYCGAGEHNIYIYTGAHSIDLTFEPPTNEVEFYTSTGRVQYSCTDYINTNVSWKLVYDGTLATLYQDDVLIFENVAPRIRTTNPGIIHIVTYETTTVYIDKFRIEE